MRRSGDPGAIDSSGPVVPPVAGQSNPAADHSDSRLVNTCSVSSKIDQAHPQCHEHEPEPAQRAFGRTNNFLYPEFHFFRKRKIR